MANHKIAEIFTSINGEGEKAGQLAVFIRLQGCNLNCSYCDTKWANEEDCPFHWTETAEIAEFVRSLRIRNVTITGGEPLIQPDIRELLEALTSLPDTEVEIETNGSVPLAGFLDMKNRPSFTMDYKLPGSGMEDAMLTSNFLCLDSRDMVKFVVKDGADLMRAKEIIDSFDLTSRCPVHLSPVYGEINPEDIVNFMKSYRMNGVTLQLQLHKIIWAPDVRGV